ncbi:MULTISPECIES: type II 3-dehydroquinate dehydratase [Mesonia]|uniref:3-dehydroquinate dehydratase n=1 Tax=Mesonia oceanica TaxID=2687242 RepID=A0AC61Y9H9_9FLAO|nr:MULTISPECIES: type II 3-dehydroquinate dehydratase [Mesonia]MAN27314.1 type II 3-dehydroquinate dehydratase [Mesonia sp.]MAQ42291.1 type II 3-dehydroquinate dehydratase [Mesonia sp.]MBJ98578.1 type II 3-dehydroquinate dehydratase [Flavobacteriaceae bacterium]VVV00005.1 3-dehydroquinate dehydratase [Mesonia oceanica]|tara:strand:+ start:12265 stop:12690 length:426 start_codon:yes stop_codon:yes gene_type:complete
MKILIINGPNLNLLGSREPEIYGGSTFEDYFSSLQFKFREVELSHFQSNHEGEIIDQLHQAQDDFDGVILNAAAYTHTSIAIADAVKAIQIPVVEVHISNTSAREKFRHTSFIAPNAKGVIAGFGLKSYELSVLSFMEIDE